MAVIGDENASRAPAFSEWSSACSSIDAISNKPSHFAKKRRELLQVLRVSNLSSVPCRLRQPRTCRRGLHPPVYFRRAHADRRALHQVRNSWPGENSMSRMSWPMMAAFVVMGVIALMLISGPWSPRVVEKDAAGEVVGGPPRPLAPGTPITSAPAPAGHEATR